MTFVLDGKTFETNEEGYLTEPSDWRTNIAEFMAHEDNCCLTENHWVVIHLIRDYYRERRETQGIRLRVKQITTRAGWASCFGRYPLALFPEGPAKQACKYAGLPKPTGCI